ncbi:MAG: hypothetical protein MUF77_10900 [Leptospira sp.]|nr:hypothetical protein [Leptospira sp.]
MEWDQYVFYQGLGLWKKFKSKLTPTSPYFPYQIESDEIQLTKYLRTLRKESTSLVYGSDSITIGENFLKFPEVIRWYVAKNDTSKQVRILLAYLSFLYEESLDSKVFSFFKGFRLFLRKYPGVKTDWKDLRLVRLGLRKKDLTQYNLIVSYFYSASRFISHMRINFPIGKDFVSRIKQQNIESKESKQKLDPSDAELLEVDEKKIEEYTLGHNFEKIETVEEFDGQWRDIDGEEDMEEEEALEELNLKHMIRTEDPVHTTRTSESGSGTHLEILDDSNQEKPFLYPEWDFKQKIYGKQFGQLCSIPLKNKMTTCFW